MKESIEETGGRRLGGRPRNGLVGYVALFVAIFAALGGVAVGLPGKGTVTANDLKAGSVSTRAIQKGAVSRAKLGPSAQPLWVSVNADGSVISRRGGGFVSHTSTGIYYVSFGKSLAGKAITATGQLSISNGLMVTASPCAGTPVASGCDSSFKDDQHMVVVIRGGNGALADEPFFVTVTP